MRSPQDSRSQQPPVKNTQSAKKPSGTRIGVYRTTSVKAKKPAQVKKSRLGGCLVTLGAIAALITAGGVIVGGIWLAILLMINPNAVIWLNQFLPTWTRIPIAITSPPQTLATIQEEVRKSRLISGEPIALKNSELLLPILASSSNCQRDCEKIVELRVYQPTELKSQEKYYRLVSQLPIAGPEEYIVLSSPVGAKSGNTGASRSLPLTTLSRFDDKAPNQGIWFKLSGQQIGGDTPMSYGQVIHYNPEHMHLSVMLQWTSPNELQPDWQQVTGTSTPEFVINQTVGLEPHFKVYQIKARNFVPNPIYLQEISLVQPPINTQGYRNALMLAGRGLWSLALQLLQSEKKNNWSAAAQEQMDVIRLHAEVTQSQAKQAWATLSTSILANLIDGRWADALLMFRASEPGVSVQEITTLLKTDSGGLWDRVEAALKVNPNDNNVRAWGALILTVQQGRPKAIAWLKQLQKNKPVDNSQINELLDHLDATSTKVSTTTSHASRIVGTAKPVTKVNPTDWLQLEAPLEVTGQVSPSLIPNRPAKKALSLTLEPQQVWYQVQVAAFNDGKRWRQPPFSNLPLLKDTSAKQLWNYLGLDNNSKIQISVWTAEGSQESTIATIKGVSYQGDVIQLLAAGEPLPAATPVTAAVKPSHALAYTEAALSWLDPGSMTFTDLNQLHPQWVSAILPAVWRELLKRGQVKQGALPSMPALLADMGHWSIQLVELTGDNEPEVVLSLYEDLSGALKKPDIERPVENSQLYKPRTVIFSNKGGLLYSEFSKDASTSLTAIADLGDAGSAALILSDKSNYSLKRWSPQRKRFE
ncbi:MAG TPA: hypothetical protein V6D14_31585 [Coleofasciculaceae cyanobacterium]